MHGVSHDSWRVVCALVLATALGACGGDSTPMSTVTVPASMSLTISASSIPVGGTAQLAATPRDKNGTPMTAPVSYSSSATNVATVSPAGLVTGVSPGMSVVSANSGTAAALLTVTVTNGAFPSSAIVTTPGNSFAPFQVDIAAGGSVQWQFGSVGHNVLFDNTAGAPAGIPITMGANASRTFAAKGTFNYQCTVHTGMVGVVVVH